MKTLFRASLALVLLAACATTGATKAGEGGAGLSLGLVSYSGADTAASDAQVLQAELTHRLGRGVSTKVFPTEGELSAAVAEGKVDLAWLPPFAFVDAEAKGKVTPLVKAVRRGLPFYRSVLFVKSDSKAAQLKDLQGANVAWVEKNSAAGYLFPRATILQAGLKPTELFKAESFLGNHAAVCKAVLEGKADVGATYADDRSKGEEKQIDGCLQSAGPEAVKGLRIIATSAPIPNDVVAARPGFSLEEAARVQKIFSELKPSGDDQKLLTVFKAEGFVDVGAEDFEPVRFAADAAK